MVAYVHAIITHCKLFLYNMYAWREIWNKPIKSEINEYCNKKLNFKVKDVYLHAFLKSNLNTQ